MKLLNNKYIVFLLVFFILVGGVIVRTYRLTSPLADWHSWRQADTAAVARNFVKDKFNLLYPQSDSLYSLNENGLPNPNRYFINEFPLYNSLVALIYQQFGVNVMYGRLVSIAFSTLGALALYGIVNILVGIVPALITLAYYSFLPYNIYYSRVFMPDPAFIALSIISLYWCVKWVKSERTIFGVLLMVTFATALLVKPYAIFMAIPMFYWVIVNWGIKAFKSPLAYIIAVGSFIPFLLWRYHSSLHPEGSFGTSWLLNEGNIRFTGAFFRWLIFDRLNRLIFASGGFVLMIVGFMSSHLKKNTSLFFVWTLSVMLYMTIFAKGNVNHDYYQLPIVAPGVVLTVLGSISLIDLGKSKTQKIFNGVIITSLFVLSIAFGWFEVRGFYNINNPAIVEAGQKVDEITPDDALVIAPYQGDPAFLYQTNRHGWPIGEYIETKIVEGADYYVTTTRDQEYNKLKSTYPVVFENDLYSIIDLHNL